MWTVLLVLAAALAPAPRPASAPLRWVLVYAGADRRDFTTYTVTHFSRLITQVDSAGRPKAWLCTGAIVLNLYAASGRVFTTWIRGTPADGRDWTEYLDSLFTPRGVLARLDSAIGLASATLGPPPDAFRVSIMIPYPDRKQRALVFDGVRYDLGTTAGRADAAAAYVSLAQRRFREAARPRLLLDGFYWLLEKMPAADVGVVTRVARGVHAQGLRLLWIPYYDADGWERWREFGFDEAWLQPNYFFNRHEALSRLDSAASRALRRGMGLEIEFDGRLTATPGFGDRLDPYLAVLRRNPRLLARSIAVFDGGGALLDLSRSPARADRLLYERLAETLRSTPP